jgi:hypothetical protein
MTSESGKNASGQEAFGSKTRETPVVESLAVSTADVTSTTGGAGAMTTSEADKAWTSTAPATKDVGGDLCTAGPLLTTDPQVAEAGGAQAEDDLHRCHYVGTPWEAEVVTDHHNVEEFEEASHTIGARAIGKGPWLSPLSFFSLGRCVSRGLMAILLSCWCSLLLNERKLRRICCGKRPMRTQKPPRPARRSCRPRSRPRKRSSASRRPWHVRRRGRRPT